MGLKRVQRGRGEKFFKKVLTYLGEVSILINARLRAKANRSALNLEKEIVLRDRNQTLVNSINERSLFLVEESITRID